MRKYKDKEDYYDKKSKEIIRAYPEILEDFHNDISDMNHKSEIIYLRQVRNFLDVYACTRLLENKTWPEFLGSMSANEILGYIENQRSSDPTKRLLSFVLIRFFKFLKSSGRINNNPLRDVEPYRVKNTDPIQNVKTLITDEELEIIFQNIDNPPGGIKIKSRRNNFKNQYKSIYALLLTTGIGLEELINIKAPYVNTNTREINLYEDIDYVRTVKYPNNCVKYIDQWIVDRKDFLEKTGQASPYLFIDHMARQLTITNISNDMSGWQTEGIEGRVTITTLKNTFATRLHQETHDLLLVQHGLNCKDPTRALHYIKYDDRSEYEKDNEILDAMEYMYDF